MPVRTTQPVASTPQLGARIGTISGLVVSAMDGRPLPRVAVRLNGHGVAQTRLTDDKGRVTFADLPPGDFTINATKTGFFDGSYGKRRASGTGMPLSLPPGVSIPDMRIELFRPAVISGFVFDEVGEPVIGTRVVALRRQFIDGRWRVTLIGEQTTDDEGNYRIFGLMPGDYFVSVPLVQVSAAIETFEEIARTGSVAGGVAAFLTPFMNSTSGLSGLDQNRFVFDTDDRHVMIASPATPPDAENGRAFAYPTVYHPAAEAVSLGLAVSVGPGEDHRGVNFALRAVRTSRITGVTIDEDGRPLANQRLRLLKADTDDYGPGTEAGATLSAPGGGFAFLRVPPGRYRIEARGTAPQTAVAGSDAPVLVDPAGTETVLWGRGEVTIEDKDERVGVRMLESLTLTGQTSFSGGPAPSAEQLGRVPIVLAPVDAAMMPAPRGSLDASGRFVIRGIVPGQYFVRVDAAPPGWYFKSAIVAGRDASETPFELSIASDVSTVAITFTNRPTEIVGTVRDARGVAAGGATIVVVPAAPTAVLSQIRTRELRSASTGAYVITGLPPGDYLVAAIDEALAEGWQEAGRLAVLRTQATRITLGDAEQRTLDLRVGGRR